jgi:hypothetical protein
MTAQYEAGGRATSAMGKSGRNLKAATMSAWERDQRTYVGTAFGGPTFGRPLRRASH